jgi:hypothetical protein
MNVILYARRTNESSDARFRWHTSPRLGELPIALASGELVSRSGLRIVLGGISESSVERITGGKGFPKPLKAGDRPLWKRREVNTWIADLPEGHDLLG